MFCLYFIGNVPTGLHKLHAQVLKTESIIVFACLVVDNLPLSFHFVLRCFDELLRTHPPYELLLERVVSTE